MTGSFGAGSEVCGPEETLDVDGSIPDFLGRTRQVVVSFPVDEESPVSYTHLTLPTTPYV